MFGRWNTPIAMGIFALGLYLAGRRVRRIMLLVLACMFVFIFGTSTSPEGWTLTVWSWLAIVGALVALCGFPRAARLDRQEKALQSVERAVDEAKAHILIEKVARAEVEADLDKVVNTTAHEDRVPYEGVTEGGVPFRDFRAVDPDEL